MPWYHGPKLAAQEVRLRVGADWAFLEYDPPTAFGRHGQRLRLPGVILAPPLTLVVMILARHTTNDTSGGGHDNLYFKFELRSDCF